MVFDELLEGLDDAPGAVGGIGAEAGLDDLVLADVVDGDLVFLLDLDQEVAEIGVEQGTYGVLDDPLARVGGLPLTPARSLGERRN